MAYPMFCPYPEKHVLIGHKHDMLGNQTAVKMNGLCDSFHIFHLLVV